ncbi:ABC transporter permease [Thioalkalivibrio sp. ALMg11]|uniref:ABC transporter permease n=1 Tax=Thioalkalivibrio sp. ALMg11 TaxID=1158165 RepID=UPI0003736013|nr:ABC transporter permease [Thioalkalivibrio sp. ALMg11]
MAKPAMPLLPRPSLRFVAVWRRNLLVWRKLIVPSMLGNFGEPILYLLAFGYGFGSLVGDLDGMRYMVFIASGIICSSAMFTASFEGMYSAYTRMAEQNTWLGMLATPLTLDDIVFAEASWAATKGLISAITILIVASVLGLVADARALLALPVIFLAAFTFGALALVITALARSYDFFLYYFTLAVTPMLLLSGVFFPLTELPGWVQGLALALPLAHVLEIVRPLMTGAWPTAWLPHLAVIAAYGGSAIVLATYLIRRRLLR